MKPIKLIVKTNSEKYPIIIGRNLISNLSEIFICSKVEFKVSNDLENDDIRVNCKKVSGLKCERCWKISDDVKIDSSLCPRCTDVIDTLR